MGRAKCGTTNLEATRESLAIWRRQHGGPGRPFPVVFWKEARELARVHGVAHTARQLRLDANKLAKAVEETAIAPTDVAPAAFVQLGDMDVSRATDAALVEFVGRGGDRVRVQIAASALDLVALAGAFWGGRR